MKNVCRHHRIGRANRHLTHGFTLLEVLMAVGLLAVTSALVISTLSGGLQQVRWSTQASEASMHAQSLLDTVGTLEAIEPTSKRGVWDDGRFQYQFEIKAVPDPSIDARTAPVPIESASPPILYQMSVLVTWGSGKPQEQLRFTSYRVRQAPANSFSPTL